MNVVMTFLHWTDVLNICNDVVLLGRFFAKDMSRKLVCVSKFSFFPSRGDKGILGGVLKRTTGILKELHE